MKQTIAALVITLFNSFMTFGQSYNWQWADRAGGYYTDRANDISTDANGNSYITGFFYSSTITFGSTVLTNTSSINHNDLFLVKYNSIGNVVWAKSIGGTAYDEGKSIYADANGYVYITGTTASASITVGNDTFTNPNGSYDILVIKIDSLGNVVWAKSVQGTGHDYGNSIVADEDGNVYVAGNFTSDSITFGNTVLTNINGNDFFIVKYDSSGNVVWAKSAGGTGHEYNNDVTADINGNVYATGNFISPTMTFDTITITSMGVDDFFIVKYDSSGNVAWAKGAGGNGMDGGNGIDTDTMGYCYVTGYFRSPNITFGGITLTNTDNGSGDVFIVKYDTLGNVIWAKNPVGSSWDTGGGIKTDPNGNSYLTGNFMSATIFFDTISLTNTSISNSDADIFIVKYDSSGNALWAQRAGGDDSENVKGLSTDIDGNCYISGFFQSSTIAFGNTTLTNANPNENPYADIFIAKLNSIITDIEQEDNINEQINVFPNPSNGIITITAASNNISEIKITDLLGQILSQAKSNNKSFSFQVDKSGIYLITLTTRDNQQTTRKVIVQH